MSCEYVRQYYGVPAEIGRRVVVGGKPGVIAEDRGHYIGVNFDADKPGVIRNAHPTSEVQYGEIGEVRRMTKSQERYARYQRVSECFDSFIQFCYYDADRARGGAS
ncbi:MAG: hypothetical protein WC205_04155 [Opitutaceae bacterium]|jgi:hypothetical protein